MATDIEKAPEALQQLVADTDTGGRKPTGVTAKVIFTTALAWALFLAFLAWPASKRSPRDRVPVLDWALALAGAFAGAYLLLFYAQLATRPGQPTTMDVVTATVGIVLLLEATRRAVGWPMAVLAI